MAHLVDNTGYPIAIGDGLGVQIENWQVGDILVQQHRLGIPQDTTPGTYWVQTGVYTWTGLQRLAVVSEGQVAGDRIVLARIDVK